MQFDPAALRFVEYWGEMGVRWGIDEDVARVHALLFMSARALNTTEIGQVLGISTAAVRKALKELEGRKIVEVRHRKGQRRAVYTCEKDVWETFRALIAIRKETEFDPTVEALYDSLEDLDEDASDYEYTRSQLEATADVFEKFIALYEHMERVPTPVIVRAVNAGANVTSIWDRLIKR